MMVRGGDKDLSEDDESYSDTDTDTETENEDGDIVLEDQSKATPEDIQRAQRQLALSQQSRNFGIATALWSSLFFDTILNKAKRQYLFPAAAEAATLVTTTLLASGFALASCVSFLLWRDFDVRSEMDDESDDGEDIKKGDWFLSLSCFTGDEDNRTFASHIRAGLYFHLALFGLLNLCAHAGYYFSEEAPFLGLSAAAINVHNTLAVANAFLKEANVSEFVTKVLSWPLNLFRGKEKSRVDATGLTFQLAAAVFWFRCMLSCKAVISLTRGLLAGADPSSVINNSRQLSLGIASLGRLTLAAGVSQVLFSSKDNSISHKMRNHPFFAVLSGISSLICFGMGGSLLLSSFPVQASRIMSKSFPFDGVLLSMMGVLLGYNSAMGIVATLKELRR